MNPTDDKTPQQVSQPSEPIVGNQPTQQQATPGTESRTFVKIWIPRCIIAAILVNSLPGIAFSITGADSHATIETIRNYANIGIIILFVIIIFKQLTEKNP